MGQILQTELRKKRLKRSLITVWTNNVVLFVKLLNTNFHLNCPFKQLAIEYSEAVFQSESICLIQAPIGPKIDFTVPTHSYIFSYFVFLTTHTFSNHTSISHTHARTYIFAFSFNLSYSLFLLSYIFNFTSLLSIYFHVNKFNLILFSTLLMEYNLYTTFVIFFW